MNATAFEGLSIKDLVGIQNKIADSYEDIEKLKSFTDRTTAAKRIGKLLEDTGERVIRLLKPEYVKRGKAADRFPHYKDGMLASEYVSLCEEDGVDPTEAKRDIRYDNQLGLIRLV